MEQWIQHKKNMFPTKFRSIYTYVIPEVDRPGVALVGADDAVAVRGIERQPLVCPRAAREGDGRPADAGPVGEDALHHHALDKGLEVAARRSAGDGQDLVERVLRGAGGHERERDVDGERREDKVSRRPVRRDSLQQARGQRRLPVLAGHRVALTFRHIAIDRASFRLPGYVSIGNLIDGTFCP